ncbi:MAG: GIY-YIG nuclease family protein [Cytophagaceae bacterium]
MKDHQYFVYITTNPAKTVLYTGVTNDLERRMQEHYESQKALQGNSFVIDSFGLRHSTISMKRSIVKKRLKI